MAKPSKRVRLRAKPGTRKHSKVRLPIKSSTGASLPREGSKLATMLTLLTRPIGASLGELVHVTGWREHSVRAALTGIAKERTGLRLTSVKSWNRRRRYYITSPQTQDRKILARDA